MNKSKILKKNFFFPIFLIAIIICSTYIYMMTKYEKFEVNMMNYHKPDRYERKNNNNRSLGGGEWGCGINNYREFIGDCPNKKYNLTYINKK
jgi:hypothetical protein